MAGDGSDRANATPPPDPELGRLEPLLGEWAIDAFAYDPS
jgi:hypothetical protein